ncbi:unnamed protein product [Leptidea sinapis]|uniref:Uncharacterized protein n=1 Tax=Leptidea sinapis TaxID=189913 RepID=A0A5E4PYU5_9NEOP|nr:unnamed protein product [Leptidea sinapis]
MTVKKSNRCGGWAAIAARHKLHSSSHQLELHTIKQPNQEDYNIIVGFNEKDQLQLTHKQTKEDNDDDKLKNNYNKTIKYENIAIDDITNCVNIENYPTCENTLVFYVTKNLHIEAIALKFENEQDFKRIYFTYKYFKMRNRLTKTSSYSYDNLFSKKKTDLFSNRKNSIDDYSLFDKGNSEYDLMQKDYDGITHLSVQHKGSRFDQPMSLIGIRNEDIGEIDSIIHTDIDITTKPQKKKLFNKKQKAPSPPLLPSKDSAKVLKGEYVRVSVERSPDVVPKDYKQNKIPDILMFREKSKKPASNLWTSNKGEQVFL